MINIVCNNALISGYATDRRIIDRETIKEVIDGREVTAPPKKSLPLLPAVVLLALILLALAAAWLWGLGKYLLNLNLL